MSRYRVYPSFLLGFLLTLWLGSAAAQRTVRANFNCEQVKNAFELRVSELKLQQKGDINQCRTTNGKSSEICRKLKEQQKEEMRQLRGGRDAQLQACIREPFIGIDEQHLSQSRRGCGNQGRESYVEEDDTPEHKPPSNPPPAKIGPPEKIGPPVEKGPPNAVQPPLHQQPPRPLPGTSGGANGGPRSSANGNSYSSGGGASSSGSSGSHGAPSQGSSGGGYSGSSSSSSSSAGHSSGGSASSSGSSGSSSASSNSGAGASRPH
jgi:hypothetical protein